MTARLRIYKLFFIISVLMYSSSIVSAENFHIGRSDLKSGKPSKPGNPKIQSMLSQLIDKVSKDKAQGKKVLSVGKTKLSENGLVKIVLETEKGKTIDRDILKTMGARIIYAYKNMLVIELPVDKIEQVAEQVPGVINVRLPYTPIPLEISEGVELTGADHYQVNGSSGAGVKVAVIDIGFEGLSEAQANGDLPYNVITSTFEGTPIGTGNNHGTACAEIVYDMAPAAQLYLLKISDDASFDEAVEYCKAQQVDIISCSLGWIGITGPGDGTGTINDTVYSARVSSGILWVNSAGNSATRHWAGTFTDANLNDYNEFPNNSEGLKFNAQSNDSIVLTLRWKTTSWNYCDQNYDLLLATTSAGLAYLVDWSNDVQNGLNCKPLEQISFTAPHSGYYYILISKSHAAGPAPEMEIFLANHDITDSSCRTAAGSIVEPADSSHAVTVGAVGIAGENWASSLETFSSQGPTKDNRTKPDICGPDGTESFTYPERFFGTSAAAPHVAGAAALVLSRFPGYSADDLEAKLFIDALESGTPGKDNMYGYGRLNLSLSAIPLNPRCEGAVNPINITEHYPTFSWSFSGQSAYQILIASTTVFIDSDTGNVWDSMKVISTTDTVKYSETRLSGNCTYYWKLRCWNVTGATSPYCFSQTFSIKNSTPFAPANPASQFPEEINLNSLIFSWVFSDPDFADMQTAYELLVSTGLQELNLNSGGKWRRKEFTSSALVQYGGSSLEYGTSYYWKIRTWDIKNVTGPYCSAQVFKTTDRPTDFTGVALSTSAIIWKWRDNCKEACTYTVFDGTTTAKSPVLGQDTTCWMEAGLLSNTQNSRRVALNIGASTKFSNSYCRYTLAKVPTGFAVTEDNIGDHSVVLQWLPEGGSHFGVARTSSQAKVNYVWLATGIQPSTGTYTFYTDRYGLFARTTYSYILKGYNGDDIETSTTTAVTITTKQDTTPPGAPALAMLPLFGNDGIGTNQEIIITGMAVDGEPELRIADLKILDQTGFVLYQRGVDNNDIFDENVEIDWITGLISGSIKINNGAGVRAKHRVATYIILQITIEDYNDPENTFTSQGFSNAIKLLGESKELNAYLPSGKVAINPQAGEEITIYYEVDNPCNVELGIYTVTGDKVKSLVNTWRESGCYLEKWNGRNDLWGADVASGIYLIHCNIGGERKIKKVAVMNE